MNLCLWIGGLMRVIIDDRIVYLSPGLVAKEFWDMDSQWASTVFLMNWVGIISIEKLSFQLQYVTDSPYLHRRSSKNYVTLLGTIVFKGEVV